MNDERRGQGQMNSGQPFFGVSDAELEVPQRADNVLDLFCGIVDSNRSAPAVSWRGVDTTYQELDALSSQVAHALIASGAVQGSIVAIFLSNPVDQIAATLGCLKAGCIFASMDVSHPAKRLVRMLETVGAGWVILEASTGLAFSALLDGRSDSTSILVMGDERLRAEDFSAQRAGVHQVAEQGTERILVPTLPDDPCYIYFTSGSTGTPKAILGRIRGLAHFIQWEIATFALGPGSRVSQLTGPAFDVYLRDVFAPLCCGGTVCIPPEARFLDPILLGRWIEQARVTLIHCVPSVFRLLLRLDLAPDKFPALEFVLLAGESLPPADANAWITCFGERIRLVNLYGPTETTLAKFFYRLPATPVVDTFVPIGMPIPGAQAILLDESLAPCERGELGEIFIRTPYRTLGYYNAPDLTESVFIPNPFTTGTGDVLYRTGDLGRVLPDGNFRIVGRKDFQLKIRGNRVELGEIESRLQEHPRVREAVVLAREDRPGDVQLVAYYVPRSSGPHDSAVSAPELRKHLADFLPLFMVPAMYVVLESLPLSANGKLDRGALPAPGTSRPELAVAYAPPIDDDEKRLCEAFAGVLGIDLVGRHDNFFEIGGNSLLALSLLERVREGAAGRFPATLIFGHPTPASLAVALAHGTGDAVQANRLPNAHRTAAPADHAMAKEPIAIIAMAGRFPGASDVEQFWDNLCAGRDSITVFRRDQLDPSIAAADRDDPAYVAARGIIDGVEDFDAGFFGINPREAQLMDPQHRIFLELCWECMERGGQVPDASTAPVGVFAGTYHTTYLRRHVAAHPDLVENVGEYQVTLNNEKDYIATRIAHKLNLTGPAISMYTACSTSLVAICQAVEGLQAGSCDMALAGGVSIVCPPRSGRLYQEGAMFSPDGQTRTFDAGAQGTAFSDGGAVVLLKRLSDAIKDGNQVHAVLLGGAVNNDGGGKASFTAPSSAGQAAVIAMAHDRAQVDPRSISYVEAHGTATPMGDPIEIEGLTKAFRRGTNDTGFCRIGSVKSNVGHLVIAAGAAGVIKTALALAERRIPASLHFDRANPAIDFSGSPFVVNAALADWPADAGPRRAGVSSFGVGGTNAHVVMEEAPALPASEPASGPQLLVLSARTPTALARAATQLAEHLETQPDENLADVAWTLAAGRKAFAHRLAVVADGCVNAAVQLRSPEVAAAAARGRPAQQSDVVFLFPGQGATYPGMGRGLYAAEPAFRKAFDECADALHGDLGVDLRQLAFADDPEALLPTAIMQPATFAIEYALARVWMGHGIAPAAMIGHSVGEFVAATLAGVFTLPDALRLVARRGALMQAQPAGGMLSVRLAQEDLLARMPAALSLAAENAPGACVVAGPIEAIADFQARLEAEGIACRPLRTSHAFHSQMMEPVVAPFRNEVAALQLSTPILPLVSTATGNWLDAANAMSPDYWASHLRQPVRFSTALGRVLDTPTRVLLEIGPRASLSALARQQPGVQQHHITAVATLADTPAAEAAALRLAAGQLWSRGVALDPAMFDRRDVRRRVRLPTYPFERQRFWVEAMPAAASNVIAHSAAGQELTGPHLVPAAVVASPPSPDAMSDRRSRLVAQLKGMFEDLSGMAIADDDMGANFIELGLDSLMLTQAALRARKIFGVPITFRQLMGECATLNQLAAKLEDEMRVGEAVVETAAPPPTTTATAAPTVSTAPVAASGDYVRQVVDQQMALMQRQLALLDGTASGDGATGGIEIRRQVIEQQQLLMARQLALLSDAVPAATVNAPPESHVAAGVQGVDALEEIATMRKAPRPLGVMDARYPVVPGAKLGRDPEGRPAWFIANPERPGKFLKVGG